jgi:hypothetical protein
MRQGSVGPGLRLAAALVICSQVHAAGPVNRCAELRDDAERLACYDAEFGKPTAAVPSPASESAEKDFGLAAHGTPQRPEIASVTSVVAAVARQRDGRFLVTLANGQLWAQSELESKASVETGDYVTVRRAAFGSYLIVTKSGIATRVKRVK